MSINLTDELLAKTKKGKIASAKQVFLEGDQENLQQIGDKTHQLEDAIKDITVSGGASTANAVSYNNETSGMTAVTAQGAIDELAAKNATKAEKAEVTAELEKKFDKESILQESGDAEDKVMSQKATSTAIADETTRAKAAEEAIIFDVSAHNNDAVFESLLSLLSSSNLDALIPTSVRHGGMSIRFIRSSDNKYVQYRYMETDVVTVATFTNVANWQGVDDEPTAGSNNLIKSGSIFNSSKPINKELFGIDLYDSSVEKLYTNKYIFENGAIWDKNGFVISKLFSLKKNDVINFTVKGDYESNIQAIGTWDEIGNTHFLNIIHGKCVLYQSGVHEYSYVVPEDCRIGFCFRAADTVYIKITSASLRATIEKEIHDTKDELKEFTEKRTVWDISYSNLDVNNNPTSYVDIQEILNDVNTLIPIRVRSNGMSVKYMELSGNNYSVAKTFSKDAPFGTSISYHIKNADGAYKAKDIQTTEDATNIVIGQTIKTIGVNEEAVFYMSVDGGYDIWTITKTSSDTFKYVQCRHIGTSVSEGFALTSNWEYVDDVPIVNSQNTVLSGGVAKALFPINRDLLGVREYNSSVELYIDNKYIYYTGQLLNSNGWAVSQLLDVKKGDVVQVEVQTIKTDTQVIATFKNDGTLFLPELERKCVMYAAGVYSYSYIVVEDSKIAVCFKKDDRISIKISSITMQEEIDEINETLSIHTNTINELYYSEKRVALTPMSTGEAINVYAEIVNLSGYAYSNLVHLRAGETISFDTNIGNFYAPISHIVGGRIYVLREGSSTSNHYEFTADSDYDLIITYKMQEAPSIVTIKRRVYVDSLLDNSKEHVIVGPYHNEAANGDGTSIFNAEVDTYEDYDGYAQNLQQEYDAYISRQIMGKDASGSYDISRYLLTKRDMFAYRNGQKLFAWNDGTNIVYTDSFCPVPDDNIYSDINKTVLGTVDSYNSKNAAMVVGGSTYTRDTDNNVEPEIVYANYELKGYIASGKVPNGNEVLIINEQMKKVASNITSYDNSTDSITIDSKVYVRDWNYDKGYDNKYTLVFWGNEHGPKSDPMIPCITLLKFMGDLAKDGYSNPLLNFIKRYCRVFVIPCVNPYGLDKYVENKRNGRYNFNGVNINRNYDYLWENFYSQDEPKGNSAGDQPEARYVMDTCAVYNANMAIDFHCLGIKGLNVAGYDAVISRKELESLRQEMKNTYNKYLQLMGNSNSENPAEGSGFICHTLDIVGGLIEAYPGNVNPYSASVMQFNYDFFLKWIRIFLRQLNSSIFL